MNRLPGEPIAPAVKSYRKSYSFKQHLDNGNRCSKLRPLQGGRSEDCLAPESLRPIFIPVLTDCLALA